MDVPRIERVLANLINNALKHTPAGGVVRVSASATSKGVRVGVSDTGEGISHQDLPRVFGRFYRGEEDRRCNDGGAGLGLAIARGIVEAHGGSIEIESTASVRALAAGSRYPGGGTPSLFVKGEERARRLLCTGAGKPAT
jgi:two-component system OmpR family sensor kinase/two-component system sensor histidine kinase BaeS